MYIELAVLALFIFCYSLVAGRVERAAASGPIVFVIAGLLMGPLGQASNDEYDRSRCCCTFDPTSNQAIAEDK